MDIFPCVYPSAQENSILLDLCIGSGAVLLHTITVRHMVDQSQCWGPASQGDCMPCKRKVALQCTNVLKPAEYFRRKELTFYCVGSRGDAHV